MWLLSMTLWLLSTGGFGVSTSSHQSTSAMKNGQNGDCLTRNGVTHCWERLGFIDAPAAKDTFHVPMYQRAEKPSDWGTYPLEKRE